MLKLLIALTQTLTPTLLQSLYVSASSTTSSAPNSPVIGPPRIGRYPQRSNHRGILPPPVSGSNGSNRFGNGISNSINPIVQDLTDRLSSLRLSNDRNRNPNPTNPNPNIASQQSGGLSHSRYNTRGSQDQQQQQQSNNNFQRPNPGSQFIRVNALNNRAQNTLNGNGLNGPGPNGNGINSNQNLINSPNMSQSSSSTRPGTRASVTQVRNQNSRLESDDTNMINNDQQFILNNNIRNQRLNNIMTNLRNQFGNRNGNLNTNQNSLSNRNTNYPIAIDSTVFRSDNLNNYNIGPRRHSHDRSDSTSSDNNNLNYQSENFNSEAPTENMLNHQNHYPNSLINSESSNTTHFNDVLNESNLNDSYINDHISTNNSLSIPNEFEQESSSPGAFDHLSDQERAVALEQLGITMVDMSDQGNNQNENGGSGRENAIIIDANVNDNPEEISERQQSEPTQGQALPAESVQQNIPTTPRDDLIVRPPPQAQRQESQQSTQNPSDNLNVPRQSEFDDNMIIITGPDGEPIRLPRDVYEWSLLDEYGNRRDGQAQQAQQQAQNGPTANTIVGHDEIIGGRAETRQGPDNSTTSDEGIHNANILNPSPQNQANRGATGAKAQAKPKAKANSNNILNSNGNSDPNIFGRFQLLRFGRSMGIGGGNGGGANASPFGIRTFGNVLNRNRHNAVQGNGNTNSVVDIDTNQESSNLNPNNRHKRKLLYSSDYSKVTDPFEEIYFKDFTDEQLEIARQNYESGLLSTPTECAICIMDDDDNLNDQIYLPCCSVIECNTGSIHRGCLAQMHSGFCLSATDIDQLVRTGSFSEVQRQIENEINQQEGNNLNINNPNQDLQGSTVTNLQSVEYNSNTGNSANNGGNGTPHAYDYPLINSNHSFNIQNQGPNSNTQTSNTLSQTGVSDVSTNATLNMGPILYGHGRYQVGAYSDVTLPESTPTEQLVPEIGRTNNDGQEIVQNNVQNQNQNAESEITNPTLNRLRLQYLRSLIYGRGQNRCNSYNRCNCFYAASTATSYLVSACVKKIKESRLVHDICTLCCLKESDIALERRRRSSGYSTPLTQDPHNRRDSVFTPPPAPYHPGYRRRSESSNLGMQEYVVEDEENENDQNENENGNTLNRNRDVNDAVQTEFGEPLPSMTLPPETLDLLEEVIQQTNLNNLDLISQAVAEQSNTNSQNNQNVQHFQVQAQQQPQPILPLLPNPSSSTSLLSDTGSSPRTRSRSSPTRRHTACPKCRKENPYDWERLCFKDWPNIAKVQRELRRRLKVGEFAEKISGKDVDKIGESTTTAVGDSSDFDTDMKDTSEVGEQSYSTIDKESSIIDNNANANGIQFRLVHDYDNDINDPTLDSNTNLNLPSTAATSTNNSPGPHGLVLQHPENPEEITLNSESPHNETPTSPSGSGSEESPESQTSTMLVEPIQTMITLTNRSEGSLCDCMPLVKLKLRRMVKKSGLDQLRGCGCFGGVDGGGDRLNENYRQGALAGNNDDLMSDVRDF